METSSYNFSYNGEVAHQLIPGTTGPHVGYDLSYPSAATTHQLCRLRKSIQLPVASLGFRF